MTFISSEDFKGYSASGTTGDAYTRIITGPREKSSAGMVKNTGATNSLRVKYTCIHIDGGMEMPVTPLGETVFEFTVAPGDEKHLAISIPHWELYVNVKSDTAGNPTTYAAEFSISEAAQ